MKYTSKSLDETRVLAQKFLDTLVPGDKATVVALYGNLGSGKTSFTQKVGEILGVKDNVNSPTFVIEKIYEIDWKAFKKLIHIDAYRLEKESELLNLGWDDIVRDKENLIFIEWPDNVKGLIPSSAKKVSFTFVDENIRDISFDIAQDMENE
jgi:tRNA threonylcarbamoyladenosine biosynthesis protein TsaE